MPAPNTRNHNGLTLAQQAFCDTYLTTRNGTQSYYEAYKGCRTMAGAARNADRLMAENAYVKAYLARKLAEIDARWTVTRENILQEESRLSYFDPSDLITPGGEFIPLDELPVDARRAVAGFKCKETLDQEGRIKKRVWEYKFWDKGKSLERLEKHLGMYERDNDQQRPVTILLAPDARVSKGIAYQPPALAHEVSAIMQTEDGERGGELEPALEPGEPVLADPEAEE